jgi:hypothetical protein
MSESRTVSCPTRSLRRLAPLLILVVALGLSSCDLFRRTLGVPDDCDRYRREIAFATSDHVVRGTWTGTLEGWPTAGASRALALDLNATYEDPDGYLLEGTFELEGEPSLLLAGAVSGGCAERYVLVAADVAALSTTALSTTGLSTASLPPPASLEAVAKDGGQDVWRTAASWGGFVHGARDSAMLEVRLSRVDGGGDGFDAIVALTRTAEP